MLPGRCTVPLWLSFAFLLNQKDDTNSVHKLIFNVAFVDMMF